MSEKELKMVSQFVTIVIRLGADKCAARAVDGPQGRDWLVQPCASATSSPDGPVRSGASRCSLNPASVDASNTGESRLSDQAPETTDWWSRAGFGTREVAPTSLRRASWPGHAVRAARRPRRRPSRFPCRRPRRRPSQRPFLETTTPIPLPTTSKRRRHA